jgi:hypothetical protein
VKPAPSPQVPAAGAASPPPQAHGATSLASVAPTPPRAAQSVAAVDIDVSAAPRGPGRPKRLALVAGGAVVLVVALVVGLRGSRRSPAPVAPPKAAVVAAPSAPPVVPSAPSEPPVAAAPPAPAPAEQPAEPERASPAPHRKHVAVATKAASKKRKAHPKGRRAARDVDAPRAERHRPVRKVALAKPAKKEQPAGDREAARAAYERGNGLLFSGDAAGAAAAYQEAVRLAPADPVGYRGLGLAYEKEGKIDDAISALVSYLKLSKHAHDRELIARRLARLTHARK